MAVWESGIPTSGMSIESRESEYDPVAVSTPAVAPGASDGVPEETTSLMPLMALSAGFEAPPASSEVLTDWAADWGAKAMAAGDTLPVRLSGMLTSVPSMLFRSSIEL